MHARMAHVPQARPEAVECRSYSQLFLSTCLELLGEAALGDGRLAAQSVAVSPVGNGKQATLAAEQVLPLVK